MEPSEINLTDIDNNPIFVKFLALEGVSEAQYNAAPEEVQWSWKMGFYRRAKRNVLFYDELFDDPANCGLFTCITACGSYTFSSLLYRSFFFLGFDDNAASASPLEVSTSIMSKEEQGKAD